MGERRRLLAVMVSRRSPRLGESVPREVCAPGGRWLGVRSCTLEGGRGSVESWK